MSAGDGPLPSADPLAATLSGVVDRYKQGEIGRFAAQSEIFERIGADTGSGGEFDKSGTAAIYLEQIAEVDELNAVAQDRGNQGPSASTPRPAGASSGQRRKRRGSKPADDADSSSSDGDNDNETGPDRPAKRWKAMQDPSKFAFARTPTSDLLDGLTLSSNCQKTRELTGLYALDPARTKWELKFNGSGHLPPLPDAEWSRVLANRPVNLDAINTGSFSSELDDKVTHKLGEFSISTSGAARTSKPITSGLEWYHAFDLASDAIVHAFPHRRLELRVYREYIQSLFGALQPGFHGAIINLDKAIRKHVSESPNLELSHIASFSALQMAYLSPAGIGSSRGSSTLPQAKARGSGAPDPNEICKQFNANQCVRRVCKFRHVCDTRINGALCRGDHRRSECPKKN